MGMNNEGRGNAALKIYNFGKSVAYMAYLRVHSRAVFSYLDLSVL